ncbi:PHP domain-containing protein [Salinisphaera sp. LB1]|uniref:PHP domain-containing protein n=1 Tax=Salinisphaera sp. LB1 TaxID=2183911 RepID=UPI000D7078F4|nr:PHP domain-containing protein [Salinisphaera sp. LB1]AWN17883.1 putative metal-dependent phosphoesterase (PHP family) [Salinisphaera sp. LB1]
MIDLHTHSTASDGQLDPSALVARAASRGVQRLALTDHDTTAGVNEARRAAADHGIQLVAGAEISASWERRTLHVVGLGLDIAQPTLVAGLSRQQAERDTRAALISERLARVGLEDGCARARSAADGGQITRSHFADLLVADGLVRNRQDAFKRYLRPGRPGYRRTEWAGLADVIGWIHAAGGTAVLAHPFGYGFSGAWRRHMVAAFADAGGDAIEICTGVSTVEQESQSARDARRHALAGSIGSDFHSPEQFWLDVGRVRPLPPHVSLAPHAA